MFTLLLRGSVLIAVLFSGLPLAATVDSESALVEAAKQGDVARAEQVRPGKGYEQAREEKLMKILVVHDDNCPLGLNGLEAYWEAREALADIPPEYTLEDRIALSAVWQQLEDKQVCSCGAEEAKKQAKVWQDWGRKF